MRVRRAAAATAVVLGLGALAAPAAQADGGPAGRTNPADNWFGAGDVWYHGGSFGGSGDTAFGGSGTDSFGGSGTTSFGGSGH
ncbi:MAG: hypothetical protein HOV68_21905 [Streptomycetaceae bacterium]|nr:hypothetical protein [Streptomycetaceae bacterium]